MKITAQVEGDFLQSLLSQVSQGIIDIQLAAQQIRNQGIEADVCGQMAGMPQTPELIQLSNALQCNQIQMPPQQMQPMPMSMNEEMSNENTQL